MTGQRYADKIAQDDPADWSQTCPLGCHVFFDTMKRSLKPYEMHRKKGTPMCKMAAALRNAHQRYYNNRSATFAVWDQGEIGMVRGRNNKAIWPEELSWDARAIAKRKERAKKNHAA